MASGSSGRSASGTKAFDFGTDDVLCTYDDFSNQESSNGKRSDSAIGGNSGKDFRESRMGRSSVNLYNQQEDSFSQDVLATVEKTMKKYADNLLRYLEGISGRLSQLELYCYNLERSVGEFRSDLTRDHNEADLKLRSLEKHLQEVHRSIQILRDKQELADAQKELAKLQLAQKESSHHNEEGGTSSIPESKKHDNALEAQSQQLALALPHQTAIPTSLPAASQPYKELPVQQPPLSSLPPQQPMHVQTPTYYSQQNQLPSQPPQMEQHLQAGLQYAPQRPQIQQASQPQPHINPAQTPPFPSYQQQWPQQSPQQFPQQAQPQQPSTQAPLRPQTPPVYPPYPPQPTNPTPEAYPSSMPMVSFSGVAPSRPESAAYGYGAPGRTTQQQMPLPPHNIQRHPPTQANQSSFSASLGDGSYPGGAPHPPQPSSTHGYMMYDTDGSRPLTHQPHFQQSSYPPAHVLTLQNQQQLLPAAVGARHPNSQMTRSHPYAEMIDKAVSMGYQREQVANAIHRMEESGQPVDFNSLLDRLNSRF